MVEGGAFDTLWATARDMDASLRGPETRGILG